MVRTDQGSLKDGAEKKRSMAWGAGSGITYLVAPLEMDYIGGSPRDR